MIEAAGRIVTTGTWFNHVFWHFLCLSKMILTLSLCNLFLAALDCFEFVIYFIRQRCLDVPLYVHVRKYLNKKQYSDVVISLKGSVRGFSTILSNNVFNLIYINLKIESKTPIAIQNTCAWAYIKENLLF